MTAMLLVTLSETREEVTPEVLDLAGTLLALPSSLLSPRHIRVKRIVPPQLRLSIREIGEPDTRTSADHQWCCSAVHQ